MAYILSHDGMMILPGKMFALCHLCDFASCCNPAHLALGAQADNMRDKRGKRHASPLRTVLFPDSRLVAFVHPLASYRWWGVKKERADA